MQQVRSSDVEVGLVLGRWRAARRHGIERDHDHPLGAHPQRRLDRRVQPRATVVVPAGRRLGRRYAHGREQRRDRRGRQHVFYRQVGGRDVLDPAQRVLAVSRNPALVKHDRPVAVGGARDHPEREALLADVLAQLVEIHQPCKRPRQRFGVQDRRAVHAADGQKLADVAHKPSRAANRHQRRAHVPESQIAPEPAARPRPPPGQDDAN